MVDPPSRRRVDLSTESRLSKSRVRVLKTVVQSGEYAIDNERTAEAFLRHVTERIAAPPDEPEIYDVC